MTEEVTRVEHIEPASPRGIFRLMFDRDFGIIFWGKLWSTIGVWSHNIVAALLTFELTHSAFMVGFVSALQFAPQLLLNPLSGRLTDLGHGRIQIFTGRFVCLLGSGGLALWLTFAPDGYGGALPILVSSLVVGIGFVFGGPAMQSIVPNLIRPGELKAAMQLNSFPLIIARAVGPALGAIIIIYVGPIPAFTLAAATHALFFVALFAVRFPPAPQQESDADLSFRSAVRYVVDDRRLAIMMLGIAAVGLGSEPATTLAPSLARELDGGTAFAGTAATIFGLGALVGLLCLTVSRRWFLTVRQGPTGLCLMAVGLAFTAASRWQIVTLVALAILGIGLTIAMVGLSTIIQARAPEHLRGRIMAMWLLCFVGIRPFAALFDGWLADLLNTRSAFAISAAIVLLIAIANRPGQIRLPRTDTARLTQ
ncbi:MAG: MFS transporter [Gordonia sp.]|nr:MFS transporter [Gordonia sp. (in: high G+C Gram-positive bacteria)]